MCKKPFSSPSNDMLAFVTSLQLTSFTAFHCNYQIALCQGIWSHWENDNSHQRLYSCPRPSLQPELFSRRHYLCPTLGVTWRSVWAYSLREQWKLVFAACLPCIDWRQTGHSLQDYDGPSRPHSTRFPPQLFATTLQGTHIPTRQADDESVNERNICS